MQSPSALSPRSIVLVLVLFLVLTLLFTWPLSLHLGTQIIGPFLGDNLEYLWKIWWVEHALLDLGQSPLLQPDLFYPFGYPLAYGEITPIHTYLGIPITALLGPVVTYNMFTLASFVLSGMFTFFFVHQLTESTPAGIIGGIIFAFCPYRMARIAGNLPLIDTQWLPLLFLFIERFVRRRRWTDAGLAGLSFAASSLSSWYHTAMLAVLVPTYLLIRVKGWEKLGWKSWFRAGIIFGITAFGPILPFLLPYLEVQQAGEAQVPLEQAAFWSASLTDFLLPNPRHFLWGKWVQSRLALYPKGMPYEFLLSWGIVPTILAFFGWKRGSQRGWGRWILIVLLLSLGPVFTLFGRLITIPAPASIAELVNNALDWLGRHSLVREPYNLTKASRIALPLPALLLRWYLPGLAGMRSWGRFAIVAVLGIAVLGGTGVAVFLQDELEKRPDPKRHGWRWGLTGILAGLVLFELYTGPQALISPGSRPVDEWLAAQPEQVTIIQMPLVAALSGPQMYYSMHHQQRVASGYGTYLPILFEQQYPELSDFPSDQALATLAQWGGQGVHLVLIDEKDAPAGDLCGERWRRRTVWSG